MTMPSSSATASDTTAGTSSLVGQNLDADSAAEAVAEGSFVVNAAKSNALAGPSDAQLGLAGLLATLHSLFDEGRETRSTIDAFAYQAISIAFRVRREGNLDLERRRHHGLFGVNT